MVQKEIVGAQNNQKGWVNFKDSEVLFEQPSNKIYEFTGLFRKNAP
jgi:hypothetical protein